MKPARERFFPSPSTPRAASANPDNPPHRSNSSSSGGRLHGQDSTVLSALDKLQSTGMNQGTTRPTQGYPAFMRKLATGANGFTLGSIIRPGTAEPRVIEVRGMDVRLENGNIPLIAPTPKKYHQIPPSFALPDGPYGLEALDTSRDDHSSRSPDDLTEERREEGFKMPFPKKSSVRQPESSQYQPQLLQRRREPSPLPNDCGDQDGSNVSFQRNKKRMREHDEIEDPDSIERNAKRFKTHEAEEGDKMSRHESRSPHPDRSSSTGSSAVGPYHGRPNLVAVNTSAQHLQVDRPENLDLNLTILPNRTHVGLPGRRRSEPVGLDKLLGYGSNDLLDQHADKYEALLKKWSDCSVEEWKAGAGEISSRFTMMLDFAKDYLDQKLKTCSSLNAVLDSHCEILRERKETVEVARQKAVKEAGNVLG